MRPLTVGITTRNRPASIERCLRSLGSIADLVDRAIVLDDASAPPIDAVALQQAAAAAGIALQVIRADRHEGTSAARNRIARVTASPYILNLDDDAFLVGDSAVRAALSVVERDPRVAAVAFAQADGQGRRLPDAQQPSRATEPSYVPAFIGFACLIVKDRLLAIGGYREAFGMHGEEREVCLRWLDRGWHVVYLPDGAVAHAADPSNRDPRAYVRHVMRNDCLAALYNEPLARAACIIPYKFWSFTRMRANLPNGDPGGLRWLARELIKAVPATMRERHPVKWRTIRAWRRLREHAAPYAPEPSQ